MNVTALLETGSSWAEAGSAAPAGRAHLNYDLDVDVCVVGGGLAGVTVAREVARRGWSVVVLEARRAAWNASGRSCGFVMPGFSAAVEKIVERVGLDRARALWSLSERGVAYVREAVAEAAMPGVTPVAGCLDVATTDNSDDFVATLTLLGQEFGAEIEGWPVERVRDVLKTDHYFHGLHYPTAFHVHPLHYANGLAASAEQFGARIFEDTPVLEIDPAGVRKRVSTPAARVRAGHVVLAANTLLGGLVPRLADTILPVTSFVAVTAPLARLPEAITYAGGVNEGRFADRRCRIVDGDRLMWGGAPTVWPRHPAKVARRFARDIARRFPQLGEVEIAQVWSGVTGMAVHGMPQIGEMTPGMWLASAFGSHGLNTSAMAGELIAGAIIEGDDRWRQFLPYELVWAGGAAGRTVVGASQWSQRLRVGIAASAARRRETLRRKEADESAGPEEDEAAGPAVSGQETDVSADAGAGSPWRADHPAGTTRPD